MEQINLNLIPNGILAVCHVSQYDNTGRKIRFHLFNGSDTYALSGTETITLRIRKTNGEILIFDIANTASNYIELTVLQQMTDVSGDSVCEFRLTDSGLDIGSFNFKMKIEPDAFDGNLSISEVSGNIVTFKTDLAEDLIKLDVDLEPIQDLHGYDNPWPAGGGDNVILLSSSNKSDTVFGVTYSYDAETGKITLSGTNNNTTAHGLVGFKPLEDGLITPNFQVGETYTLSVYLPLNTMYCQFTYKNTNNITRPMAYKRGTGSFSSITFTVPDDFVELIQFIIYVDGTATTLSGEIYFELVKGSTAPTSYTPYSNICPISGHDSAILSRVGKNWLNLNRTNVITNAGLYPSTIRTFTENDIWIGISRNNYFNNSRISSYSIDSNKVTVLTTAGGYGVGFPIRCKPSTAYKMANKEGYNLFNTGFFDADGNYLSDTTSSTFTTPNNCAWILIVFSGTANIEASYINPQLELGSTATAYEPYKSDPTPITVNFGQTVYKGILYSKLRKVLVTHVCETFDGSEDENWISTTTTSVRYGFRTYFQHNKKPTAQSIDEMLSSVIPLKKSSESSIADDDIITCRSTTYLYNIFYIFAPPSKISTVEELRAFLANEPETVMYPLNEPFYIDLSQEQTEDVEKTAIASFETNIQRPLETSEHYFSCSQAEGTPTPDSPIPITGVSEITAYRTGKNLTNIAELPYTIHWGTDAPELVSFLNTLPIGVYTISNKYKINGLPGNNKVQHGRFYITALIDGSQTPVLSYSVVTDTSPTVGKIYEESGTFEITASNKGKFNHAYRYCDQDTTHTGNDRGSYTCYDIQLEKASSATPYEPYNGESITVSLGGTYYGGKLVQSEDGSRKIVLTHSIGIYDGSNDEIWNDYSTGNGFFISGINDHITESYGDGLCNILPVVHSLSQLGVVFGINSKYIFLMQVKTQWNISTTNELRAFLANNPIEIVYKLETPIEIDLPDGDPLTTLAGENNVYCNTGDTALTYYFNMVADPIRIPALVGTNNVYSDAGDVDVEYYTTLEGGND